MAFDKCQFDSLFQKLIDNGLPAIIVRNMDYVNEEKTNQSSVSSLEPDKELSSGHSLVFALDHEAEVFEAWIS